jgi:hypothetical protein
MAWYPFGGYGKSINMRAFTAEKTFGTRMVIDEHGEIA